MTLEKIVSKFNTTPFLFVGSGISRRYLGLLDWRGLLGHFAGVISDDAFSYSAYENRARTMECKMGLLPKVAELIQQDFDEKWFADSGIRTVEEEMQERIKEGLSPFKAEVAMYIKRNAAINVEYEKEICKLAEISEKSIAGVITTNYDTFLEDNFQGYRKYVGQTELIFSAIQGVAEIYKIHGSVEVPDTIVINEKDYLEFEKNSAYLAAKLMTIFLEYPIIFLGYSISDSNIQNIIKAIVNCLSEKQVELLKDRFVFVEYKKGVAGVEVTPYTIMIDDKPLTMYKVTLEDFMLLYQALENKRSKLPVKLLRRFKQELYDYTISSVPTSNLRVAYIDDPRLEDEDLVLAIGKVSQLGVKGLSGIDSNEWYRNIVLDDLEFSADELLEYAFPRLLRQNSGRLPVNKYLTSAKKTFQECVQLAEEQNFDRIIPNSYKNNRQCLKGYQSVGEIWSRESGSLEKATRLISHLKEEQICVEELEQILRGLFAKDKEILQNVSANERTNIRRLIMIYDYMKWGK